MPSGDPEEVYLGCLKKAGPGWGLVLMTSQGPLDSFPSS